MGTSPIAGGYQLSLSKAIGIHWLLSLAHSDFADWHPSGIKAGFIINVHGFKMLKITHLQVVTADTLQRKSYRWLLLSQLPHLHQSKLYQLTPSEGFPLQNWRNMRLQTHHEPIKGPPNNKNYPYGYPYIYMYIYIYVYPYRYPTITPCILYIYILYIPMDIPVLVDSSLQVVRCFGATPVPRAPANTRQPRPTRPRACDVGWSRRGGDDWPLGRNRRNS